ncbi:MAG: phosphopantetheine-binding protein [Smithellaceae bacterium]|nr:phosphopantetheine-binding protein [Smithellaceae bacterium]
MDVQSTIKQYIVTEIMHELDQNVLDNEAALIEGGIIDSMNLIKLVLFIEEKYGVAITDEELDIDNFMTVNALTKFVNKKIKSAG